MIAGLNAAKKTLEDAGVKMPFEKGYDEWNAKRDNPAASPEKLMEENAKKAAEEEAKKLQEIAAAAEKKAEELSAKPPKEK